MPASPRGGRTAVLTDFDGTITTVDVAEIILERFAPGRWQGIEALHRARKIGTRETMARQFALVRGTQDALLEEVQAEARMDPAFPAFLRFCRSRGIGVEIVSEGLDFYVTALLAQWGLDVPVRTNRTVFQGGRVRIEYPFADPTCTLCGACKLRRLFELRVAGGRIVYIGDGDSDLCPAVEADVVFAKKRLADLCASESIPCHRFESFAEIQKEMEGWR
jgi:2-hydroxy-3-keto-5-methylthiopentenyl-1-phosphate phosphatase